MMPADLQLTAVLDFYERHLHARTQDRRDPLQDEVLLFMIPVLRRHLTDVPPQDGTHLQQRLANQRAELLHGLGLIQGALWARGDFTMTDLHEHLTKGLTDGQNETRRPEEESDHPNETEDRRSGPAERRIRPTDAPLSRVGPADRRRSGHAD